MKIKEIEAISKVIFGFIVSGLRNDNYICAMRITKRWIKIK